MRWLRNIFALLAIVCVMLWVVSYYYIVSARAPLWEDNSSLMMDAIAGRASIGTSYGSPPQWPTDLAIEYNSLNEVRDNIDQLRSFDTDLKTLREYLPYGYHTSSTPHPYGTWTGTNLTVPFWLPTLLFGAWPAVALVLHIKHRYFTVGICRKCGYDLRGSPSGVCPECGREQCASVK